MHEDEDVHEDAHDYDYEDVHEDAHDYDYEDVHEDEDEDEYVLPRPCASRTDGASASSSVRRRLSCA